MPTIRFNLNGETFPFELVRKITKEDLYGKVKRAAVVGERLLERGYLTADGRVVAASSISTARMDPEGSLVEKEQVFIQGSPAEILPSSFEEETGLCPEDIATLTRVCVSDVYMVDGSGLKEGLYSTWFSYRRSIERREAYLLVKSEGAFLLIGESRACPLIGSVVPYELFDAVDEATEDDDDLDFSML